MLDNTGQMRTVEAFLSIVLLFSALAMATMITPASNRESNDYLAAFGMEVLVSLDRDGQLGRLIDERSWDDVEDLLHTLLPASLSYNLTVYDESQVPVNNVTVSNGLVPDSNTVSIDYPCSSCGPQCNYYLIRLQLATPR